MTTEEQEMLERGQANLAKMKLADPPPGQEPTRQRAKRSDAGKPREKKADPQTSGFLTEDQVGHINQLTDEWVRARDAASLAEDNARECHLRLQEYLLSIKAK